MLSRTGVAAALGVLLLASASLLGCESKHEEPAPSSLTEVTAPDTTGDPVTPTPTTAPSPAPSPSPTGATTPTSFKAADLTGHGGFCPEICRRTRELRCRNAFRCEDMCKNAFADMPCPHLLVPAMECALGQPLTSWICSPDGVGAVMDGPCDDEQAAYDVCLSQLK